MAAIDTTRALTIGAPARIANFVGVQFSNFADWRDRRATSRALSALSDRELSDIGLHRGDIENISR